MRAENVARKPEGRQSVKILIILSLAYRKSGSLNMMIEAEMELRVCNEKLLKATKQVLSNNFASSIYMPSFKKSKLTETTGKSEFRTEVEKCNFCSGAVKFWPKPPHTHTSLYL